MLVGVQFIGILFGLIMMYLTYIYYKRGSYSYKSLILWMIVWIGFLLIITLPETVYSIMQALKIERTADFFVMSGFLLFSVLIFYLYMTVKKINVRMERLVRELALKSKNSTRKSNKKSNMRKK